MKLARFHKKMRRSQNKEFWEEAVKAVLEPWTTTWGVRINSIDSEADHLKIKGDLGVGYHRFPDINVYVSGRKRGLADLGSSHVTNYLWGPLIRDLNRFIG